MGKDKNQDQNLFQRRIFETENSHIYNPTFHSRSRLLPHADIFLSLPRRRHTTGRRSSLRLSTRRRSSLRLLTGRRSSLRLLIRRRSCLRLLTGRRSSLRLFILKATDRPARSPNCCCCPTGSCCYCCWPAAPSWRSTWCTVDFLLLRFFCRWFDYTGELKWTAGVAAACLCRFPFLRGDGEGAVGVSGCCTATVSRYFVFAGFFVP